MPEVDVVVVWDGRRDGPGGASLDPSTWGHPAEPPAAPETRDRSVAIVVRSRVVAALGTREMTMRELCEVTGDSAESVNRAVWALQDRGVIEKRGRRQRAGAPGRYGRQVEFIYGLVVEER